MNVDFIIFFISYLKNKKKSINKFEEWIKVDIINPRIGQVFVFVKKKIERQ